MKNDETRLIPHTGPRVETGPVKFGDDWTGVFIRGDNAFGMAMGLRALLSGASAPRSLLHNTLAVVTLTGLIELLESANEALQSSREPAAPPSNNDGLTKPA
jgi:hypothetical protein